MNIRKPQTVIARAFTLLLVALGVASQPAFAVTVSVNEGTSTATTVYIATTTGAGITYSLSGTDASAFTINASGAVKFISVPNYETKSSYNFVINAFQSSTLLSTESLAINISDLAPVITSGTTASINEGVSAATTVYTAVAADPAGGTVTYSLTGADAAAFTINSSTGVVTINSVPNFETKSSYSFNVKASDASGAFNTLTVTVSIINLPPMIISSTTASVNEGVAAATTVYTAIAADPAGGTVTYSLTGADAAAFTINSSTGVVTINSVPDFETKSSYSFNIKASDASGAFNTQTVTVSINNLSPVISSGASASVNNGANLGTTVYTAVATDPAGGAVTYSLSGADATALTIDSSTGAVTINAVPYYSIKSSYNFAVRASDSSGSFNSQAVTLTVTAPIIAGNPSVLTGSLLSNGVFEFSFTNLAGASFTVLASTNPALPASSWTVLGVVTDNPPGQYHFSEPQDPNSPQRFYRVRSP